ncbi:hypothetical protein AURDEDRAFT_161649 [Auricularia subglabra TFB-10046 SS5]|nr:hypothetical protein AURDEDRAFT_161649 [Auricularia subglabra TFB-10046 SS5]
MNNIPASPSLPYDVLYDIFRHLAWDLYNTNHRQLVVLSITCRTARRHAQRLLNKFVYLETPRSISLFAQRLRQTPVSFTSVEVLSILADVSPLDPDSDIMEDITEILLSCEVESIELSPILFQIFAAHCPSASTVFVTQSGPHHLCDFQSITQCDGYVTNIQRLVLGLDQASRLTEAVRHLLALDYMAIVVTEGTTSTRVHHLLRNLGRQRDLQITLVGTELALKGMEALPEIPGLVLHA